MRIRGVCLSHPTSSIKDQWCKKSKQTAALKMRHSRPTHEHSDFRSPPAMEMVYDLTRRLRMVSHRGLRIPFVRVRAAECGFLLRRSGTPPETRATSLTRHSKTTQNLRQPQDTTTPFKKPRNSPKNPSQPSSSSWINNPPPVPLSPPQNCPLLLPKPPPKQSEAP